MKELLLDATRFGMLVFLLTSMLELGLSLTFGQALASLKNLRFLGGPDRATPHSLGLATGSRNVAAALLVGALNFKDPRVNVMVIVTALVGLVILLPTASALGRRTLREINEPAT